MKKLLLALAIALSITVAVNTVFANDDDHHGDHHKNPVNCECAQNHDEHGHDHNHDEHGHDH